MAVYSNVVVPTTLDPRPGHYVRHLDFNHFRTIGMRRSVEEGVNSRFVTGDRVQAVLKVCTLNIDVGLSIDLFARKCQISLHLALQSIWTVL